MNKELANLVNNTSVDNLSKICKNNNIQLIHLSTDFVFDGSKILPYNESDTPNPINYYGLTKLLGENKMIGYNLTKSVIIRTSWLYSDCGNNFVSKIVEKINNHEDINVVDNQIGSPTNAIDLAILILNIIPKLNNENIEIYHFSNLGFCSRYDFSVKINEIIEGKSSINIENNLDSIAKRPKYSVLDSNKLMEKFDVKISRWQDSLSNHLYSMKTKITKCESQK